MAIVNTNKQHTNKTTKTRRKLVLITNANYTQHPDDAMKCSCALQSFGKALGEDRSWFTLSPCYHSICIDCFSRLSAERGRNSYLQCPVCKADTREWQVARVKKTTKFPAFHSSSLRPPSSTIPFVACRLLWHFRASASNCSLARKM